MDFIFSNDSCKLVARFCFPYLSKMHLCVIIIAKYTPAHIDAFHIYNVISKENFSACTCYNRMIKIKNFKGK